MLSEPGTPGPMPASSSPSKNSTWWPFGLWLIIFYACWVILVTLGDHWLNVRTHWPIALAMALGSYFAGSTPMGGGTVGFPVLVLLFDLPASLGRNFALAVQSVGMVSASIYILCRRQTLDWHLLKPAMLGSLIATPLSAALIAPFAPDLWVKLLFAIVWASFGMMHFVKLRALVAAEGKADAWPRLDRPVGLAIGVLGGVVASLTGVGVDMMIYAVLVLIYRADLKVAIPTSVILMAFTSVIGIAANLALSTFAPATYALSPEVYYNWLAAAPVVAIGAPLGALVVSHIRREPTLLIVSTLCVAQFIWTMLDANVRGWALLGACAGLLGVNIVFHIMFKMGRHGKAGRPRPATSFLPEPATTPAQSA